MFMAFKPERIEYIVRLGADEDEDRIRALHNMESRGIDLVRVEEV